MYVFPSWRYFPAALIGAIDLPFANSLKSSYATTSALINPLSKSVWIAPAASGAVAPAGIVHARTSSSPAVK